MRPCEVVFALLAFGRDPVNVSSGRLFHRYDLGISENCTQEIRSTEGRKRISLLLGGNSLRSFGIKGRTNLGGGTVGIPAWVLETSWPDRCSILLSMEFPALESAAFCVLWPEAIYRKNYLFARSDRGGESVAAPGPSPTEAAKTYQAKTEAVSGKQIEQESASGIPIVINIYPATSGYGGK